MTTLLLDADIIAFQLAATAQRGYQWPGQDHKSIALDDWEGQPERIDAAVSDLCKTLKTSEVIVCLSCPTEENWRLKVLPTYKGNRDYSQRPQYLADVKKYLEDNYPSYRRDTLEADDIMGILSTHPSLVKGKRVIVSEDKDMKTIPGWLFNPRKDKEPQRIEPGQADYWHLYQTLCGDSVDNYAGCPGIGPVKAEKILGPLTVGPLWQRVVEAFEAKHLTEGDALIQARVARICRASDYDFKKKEVRLWDPKNEARTA